jgi:hypothetical protein
VCVIEHAELVKVGELGEGCWKVLSIFGGLGCFWKQGFHSEKSLYWKFWVRFLFWKKKFKVSYWKIWFVFCTVEPRYIAPWYSANLDLVWKFFGPFNKKTFKIDLDFMRIFFGPFNRTISRSDVLKNNKVEILGLKKMS